MTEFFRDEFNGSGVANGHAPELGYGGYVWAWAEAAEEAHLTLSGGYLTSADPESWGGAGLNYFTSLGGPVQEALFLPISGSVAFRTGPSLTVGSGGTWEFGGMIFYLLFVAGGGICEVGIQHNPFVGDTGWVLYLYLQDGVVFNPPIKVKELITPALVPNTDYAITFNYADGAQSVTLGSQTVTATVGPYTGTGMYDLSVRVGGGQSISQMVLNLDVPDVEFVNWWTGFIGTSEVA